MMGLLDAFKQYVRDAMPGGSLNHEVTNQGLLDAAALVSTPVPIVGDLLGLAADAKRLKDNPSERTPMNVGLAALGVLPFVPAGMAIDPKSQKKLVEGLLGEGNPERYRLGDVKPKQAEALDHANGVSSRGILDVFMAPNPESHIKKRRVVEQGMLPSEVGLYAKQSMQPNSDVLPPVKRGDYATLVSKQVIDPKTGEMYRAQMPLRTVDDGFEVVTIIPQGKKAKK